MAELNEYGFELGGGHRIEDGKSKHPDLVRLVIAKENALDFAMDILRYLQNARPGDDAPFERAMFGKLEPLDDE